MEDDRKRRLISAFDQWRHVIELINEKAKFEYAQSAKIMPLILEDLEAAVKESGRLVASDYAVHQALLPILGPKLTTLLAWSVTHITVVDLHMLALALEHVYIAAKHLRPGLTGDAAAVAKEYIRLWRQVGDLRNALEHEEEYLAGGGKRRPKLVDHSWIPPHVGTSRPYDRSSRGVEAIKALGKTYPVGAVIGCCLNRLAPQLT